MICIWFAYYASQQHAPPNPFCSGNLFEHRGPSSNMPHISHITGCQHLHENMGKFSLKARISDIYIYIYIYIIYTYNLYVLHRCHDSVSSVVVLYLFCVEHVVVSKAWAMRGPRRGEAPAWASRWLNAESYAIQGSLDLSCDMSCDMSCDRPSQRGLGCKRLCSSCRAWKKTKAWSAESKF